MPMLGENCLLFASFVASVSISQPSFSCVIFAYTSVLWMHLWPNTDPTTYKGIPFDKQTTVAIVWRAMCQVKCF